MSNCLNKTLKSSNNSPKTPGGISKTFLTPCRRVGLSKNWKRTGRSPFISPISQNSSPVINSSNSNVGKNILNGVTKNTDSIANTPSTPTGIPNEVESQRITIKSKLRRNIVEVSEDTLNIKDCCDTKENLTPIENNEIIDHTNVVKTEVDTSINSTLPEFYTGEQTNCAENKNKDISNQKISENKSPNLLKECVGIIQKRLTKKNKLERKTNQTVTKTCKTTENLNFRDNKINYDSDDAPLVSIKHTNKDTKKRSRNESSSDFEEEKIKIPKTEKTTNSKKKTEHEHLDNSSFSDYADFDISPKKTIIIRNTYKKVSKPLRCKSTGSITQKDIDEIKARIELKKNLLLAKSKTKETEELMNLIKKWRKGCQNAVMELMLLMKRQMPDEGMDYGKLLANLHIPPSLVGYDEENECFNSQEEVSLF